MLRQINNTTVAKKHKHVCSGVGTLSVRHRMEVRVAIRLFVLSSRRFAKTSA